MLAFVAPVLLIVTTFPVLFTLPNATPELSLVLIVLEVHTTPSGLLAAVVDAPTAKNVPWPYAIDKYAALVIVLAVQSTPFRL